MSENETTGRIFQATVELDDDFTAEVVAYDDLTIAIEMEPRVLDSDTATRLALALSAAAYAVQTA